MASERAPGGAKTGNGWERLTPEERSLKAKIAARSRPGGPGRTEAARAAWRQRFYDQTDPALPEAGRQAATDDLIRGHLDRMRLASMTAARHAREAREAAQRAAAQLAAAEQEEATG